MKLERITPLLILEKKINCFKSTTTKRYIKKKGQYTRHAHFGKLISHYTTCGVYSRELYYNKDLIGYFSLPFIG